MPYYCLEITAPLGLKILLQAIYEHLYNSQWIGLTLCAASALGTETPSGS